MPVVSVSKIISRIEGLIWTLSGAETRGDGTNLAMRLAFRAAGFDDEIGARALHPIGQLKRADRLEPGVRHPRPAQHPLALDPQRRGDDGDRPDAVRAEERRVGKGWVRAWRSRWCPSPT